MPSKRDIGSRTFGFKDLGRFEAGEPAPFHHLREARVLGGEPGEGAIGLVDEAGHFEGLHAALAPHPGAARSAL